MKIIYIDPYSGISGDMSLGAMLDLGLPFSYLEENIYSLNLGKLKLTSKEIVRQGLRAVKMGIEIPQKESHHSRGLNDIKTIIERSSIDAPIKEKAIEMFQLLAEAESKVHGKDINEVHFHEVGAIDSIVDIVGIAAAFHYFSPDRVICGDVNLGSGYVDTAHGRLPVPPPAVAELIAGIPAFSDGTKTELTTPTGALILRSFVDQYDSFPLMKVEKTGYGAGDKDIDAKPSLLRLFLGKGEGKPHTTSEKIAVLEATVDDSSPEKLGYIMELMTQLPVKDVFLAPVQMKKNRPGTLLTVLVEQSMQNKAVNLLFSEGLTLGIRYRVTDRFVLDREFVTVRTDYGNIRIKIGKHKEKIKSVKPEFEDCKTAAQQHKTSYETVYREAINKYQEQEK